MQKMLTCQTALLQQTKTSVNKARNLSYFGLYQQSINLYIQSIIKIQKTTNTVDDKQLQKELIKLIDQLNHQKSMPQMMINILNGIQQTNQFKNNCKKITTQKNVSEINQNQISYRLQSQNSIDKQQKQQLNVSQTKRRSQSFCKKKTIPENNKNIPKRNIPQSTDKRVNKLMKNPEKNKKSFMDHYSKNGQSQDKHLIQMLERQVITLNPQVDFDDIAQLSKAKKILEEAVLLPLKLPTIFQGLRQPWKGVLLFGPPGTGKTLLAKAIASSGATTFFSVTASSLASKWKGDSEKLVRILFQMAQFYAPTTIFIDEIDSLVTKRDDRQNQSSRKVKTQLMARIQGLNKNNGIVIIGATNRPWDIDDAIIRRLQKKIYIPLPTQIGRKQLFQINLKKQKLYGEINVEQLALKTEGFSGADIALLCRQAAYVPMRNQLIKQGGIGKKINDQVWISKFEKDVNIPLEMQHFYQALLNVKSSVNKNSLEQFQKWSILFGQKGTC